MARRLRYYELRARRAVKAAKEDFGANAVLSQLTTEERLEGLEPQQRLEGLEPQQRLEGLTAEKRKLLRELLDDQLDSADEKSDQNQN